MVHVAFELYSQQQSVHLMTAQYGRVSLVTVPHTHSSSSCTLPLLPVLPLTRLLNSSSPDKALTFYIQHITINQINVAGFGTPGCLFTRRVRVSVRLKCSSLREMQSATLCVNV